LLGEGDKPARYQVTLHFAQLDGFPDSAPFDIRLQGKTVASDVDVAAAAGGTNRELVRTFDGLAVEDTLAIELVPHGNDLPTLCGIEVRRE